MLVQELEIPRLYKSYGRRLNPDKHTREDIIIIQSNICGHAWAVDSARLNGYGGAVQYCPFCGTRHALLISDAYVDAHDFPWLNVKFQLHKYKNSVKLIITGDKIAAYDRMRLNTIERYKETITYDLKTRITTWKCGRLEKQITPWWLADCKESILHCLTVRSPYMTKEFNGSIKKLLRKIRDYIAGSFKFKVKNINIVRTYGCMTSIKYLITNLAFRLKYPDLKDLEGRWTAYHAIKSEVYSRPLPKGAKNSVDAVLMSMDLPTITAFRRYLLNNPLGAETLRKAWRSCCHNVDLTIKYLAYDDACTKMGKYDSRKINTYTTRALRKIGYTDKEIVKLYTTWLNPNNQKVERAVLALQDLNGNLERLKKQRFSALPGYLDFELFKTKNSLMFFDYGNGQKTLEGRYRDFTFYLPSDNYQLHIIATNLHNCLDSYGRRIGAGDTTIVVINKGNKPYACLEVVGGNLQQARLAANKPISDDLATAEVIGLWAKDNNINTARFYESQREAV